MKLHISIPFLVFAIIVSSCNDYTNVKISDICDKRFTSTIPSSTIEGVSHDSGTFLKCDGTFESGLVTRMVGQNTRNRNYYTGTWELIDEINDDIIYAVKRYGIKHENYSIIKYSSSNGVTDFCLYYPSSYDGTPTLGKLNVYCDPDNSGIYGGFLEK